MKWSALDWARIIVGIIVSRDMRRGTQRALEEYSEARDRLADAPRVDPGWAARAIDRRRTSASKEPTDG